MKESLLFAQLGFQYFNAELRLISRGPPSGRFRLGMLSSGGHPRQRSHTNSSSDFTYSAVMKVSIR